MLWVVVIGVTDEYDSDLLSFLIFGFSSLLFFLLIVVYFFPIFLSFFA